MYKCTYFLSVPDFTHKFCVANNAQFLQASFYIKIKTDQFHSSHFVGSGRKQEEGQTRGPNDLNY